MNYGLTWLQLTPVLSLVLAHDLLLSKRGVALPAKHGLHATIARHKARLASELTKARLRRGCPSLGSLREHINSGASSHQVNGSRYVHPRWIRINLIRTTLDEELATTFAGYTSVDDLATITAPVANSNSSVLYIDRNVPDLVAVPCNHDFSTHAAYKEGRIIFQEKASCFPACLLAPSSSEGDIIDACAAPGNKTTHLASILLQPEESRRNRQNLKIFACEKDVTRSETLQKMTKLAGAGDCIKVKAKQDFMKLDPHSPELANVQALLLDPSCSGSGIVGRDEAKVVIHLPSRDSGKQHEQLRGKKRKRAEQAAEVKLDDTRNADTTTEEETPSATESEDATKLANRLTKLSSFQLRLLQHAMSFPSAKRITYSTCSLHKEENEHVVTRALLSDIAKDRGWKILRRQEQVEGMRSWKLRGSSGAVEEIEGGNELDVEEVADGCIRCEKAGEGGTMGFFVAGFVRAAHASQITNGQNQDAATKLPANRHDGTSSHSEEGWEGFSDSDG